MSTKRANIYIYDAYAAGNLNAPVTNISIWGGNANQFLQTDGNGNLSWANSSPGGSNTQVQFNDAGMFNGSSAFTFDRSSNILTVANTLSTNNINANTLNLSGQANFNANANITGNLLVGNITAISNISTGNVSVTANISANTFTTTGTGNLSIVATGGNLNISATTGNIVLSTPNAVVTTANVSANYYFGNGTFLTGLPASYSNADVANYLPTYTGNLDSLTGNVITTGNISANYYFGNGALLTGITASSVIGSYSNANVANYLPIYSGNISANNVNVSNNVNANTLAAVGSGNLIILSNTNILLVTSNGAGNGAVVAAGALITNTVTSNTSIQATTTITAGGNITASGGTIGNNFTVSGTANIGGNVNAQTNLAVTNNLTVGVNATVSGNANVSRDIRATGNIISGGNIISNANISALGAVFSGAGTGNVTANYFLGNGSQLTGITASSIIGSYSNANVANYLPIYGGNISANNIATGNNVSANTFINTGSGNFIISSTGNINLNPTGAVVTSANISANYYLGNGALLTGITASSVIGSYSNANVANYLPIYSGNISAGNVRVTSNVSANTFVSNGTGNLVISSTGNINLLPTTFVNITGNANANYFLGNGRFLTGLITSDQLYSNANVANYLSVYTGTVSAGNIVVSSNITANYYFGNGAYLTGVITSGNGSSFDIANYLPTYSGNLQSVTGNVGAGNVTFRGNIQGGTANFTGNLSAASGTFSGNVTAPNFIGNVVANTISATSNVIIGGNLQAGNIRTGEIFATQNISTSTNIAAGGNILTYGSLTVGGNTILQGNLQVLGTETIINTEVLNVTDKNITIANGALNPSQANGGGFIVDGANASFLYYSIPNVFVSSHPIRAPAFEANTITANVFYGTFQGNISGNLTVPGSNTQVLYNQNGNAGASSAFTFDYASNVLTLVGNVSANYYLGNGRFLTGLVTTDQLYSNANVANYLPIYSGNVGTGAGYILGNGAFLTGLPAQYSNANVANYLPIYSGSLPNLLGNVTTTANVQANAFVANGEGNLNIVSTANIILSSTQLQVTSDTVVNANVTANYYFGNGAFITGLPAQYSNANVANYLPTYTGNLASLTGNVITTANVNASNILISSTDVTGSGPNLQVQSPVGAGLQLINTASNTRLRINTDSTASYIQHIGSADLTLTSNNAITYSAALHYFNGNLTVVSLSTFASNVSINANLTTQGNIVTGANVNATYFNGNGRFLTGIASTDTIYNNANVANFLPNYTGNLQSVTGNIGSNNATLIGNVNGNVRGPVIVADDLLYGTTINGNTAILTANITTSGNVSGNAVYTNNLLQANGVPWLLGAAYFSNSLNTSNSIATTNEINANISGSPKNGDLFFDTSTRLTNHQPVYMYVNGQWRQFMTATNP
jgi:hypothetical protein